MYIFLKLSKQALLCNFQYYIQILSQSIYIDMRTTSSGGSFKYGNFNPRFSEIPQPNAQQKQKKKDGRHFLFTEKKQQIQQPKSSPINMLHSSTTPPQSSDSKQQIGIKTVSSHVIVQEDEKENLPIKTNDTQLNNEQQFKVQKVRAREEEESKIQQFFSQLFRSNARPFSKALNQIKAKIEDFQTVESFFRVSQLLQKYKANYQNHLRIRDFQPQEFSQNYAWLETQLSNILIKTMKIKKFSTKTKTFPRVFTQIATNNLQNYINELIQEKKYEQASTVANLSDKNFIHFPSKYGSKHFKAQLCFLIQKDLKFLKLTSWLFQLVVVTKMLKPNLIFPSGLEIYDRYVCCKNNQLPSQLLLFGLKCSQLCYAHRLQQQSPLPQVSEQDLIFRIKEATKNQSYLELWLLFVLLKEHKQKYKRAFLTAFQSILIKIQQPKTLVQMIDFSGIESAEITTLLNFYMQHNTKFLENRQKPVQLKKVVFDRLSKDTKNKNTWKINEWVSFSDLQELKQKGKSTQFLDKLFKDFTLLQNSDLANFKKLLSMMRQMIMDYRLCCNYKEHKRAQYYKILTQLETKLKSSSYHQLFSLIQGCKTLIQLKQGMFVLKDSLKLKNLHLLHAQLKKQQQSTGKQNERRQNAQKFLGYIKDSILAGLETVSGQLYLKQLCKEMSKQRQQLKKSGDLAILSASTQSNFSLLMRMLNGSTAILNKVALQLYFA